jgi:hypothetical protein
VTRPAHRDISVFEYLGGFRATLLAKVFCSQYWQEVCCREIETPDGKKVRVDRSLYPPGGKGRTAMRRCMICGKWAPPNGAGKACADCLTEVEAEAYFGRLQCLAGTPEEWLVVILMGMHWRRLRVRSRKEEEAKKGPDDAAFLTDDVQVELESIQARADREIPFEQQTTAGRHWLAEALEMSERPVQRPRAGAVARALRRHLRWVARDSTRRTTGCGTVLLPDDDQKLQEEITHYENKGLLMPRARHQDTLGPRAWYRAAPSKARRGRS